jgi:opacity protein-like surface antigen
MNKFYTSLIALVSLSLSLSTLGTPLNNDNPFYIGLAAGYAKTDWSTLNALDRSSQNSTPTSAQDTGPSWGAFFGWQPLTNLALEFRYQQFSDATLFFNQSLSNYPDDTPITENGRLVTATSAYSLVAKFIVPFGESGISGFADFGPVYTLRQDALSSAPANNNPSNPPMHPAGKNFNLGIMFGAGLNYDADEHWRTTLEFSYGSGNGQSVQLPVYTYIPFIYTVEFKVAYRFSLAKLLFPYE